MDDMEPQRTEARGEMAGRWPRMVAAVNTAETKASSTWRCLLALGCAALSVAASSAALISPLSSDAGPLLASTFPAPADGKGNYTQILCADPASEQGLGLSGMPEGLSNPVANALWQVTAVDTDCGTGRITSGRGVPMLVGQTNTYPQGTWSALLYQAPANATINGGTIYRAERAEGPYSGFMGIIQQGGDYSVLYSLPRNCCDQGDWYVGNVASRGTFATPFSLENTVNLTISPDRGHWDVNATCDPNGNNNSSCTLSTGQWEYRVFGGEVSLKAAKDPQASNISGPLMIDSPLRGTESVSFAATDEGPGLAYVKVLVDGGVLASQLIDANGGRCVPIPGHDPYTWAYQVPCKTSIGGRTYSFDTAPIANGAHRVQVLVEDAAGNQSTVVDRTVSVENVPPSSPAVPNGVGASPTAQLRLGLGHLLRRSFAHRALRLAGRLLDSSGHPIANATLDVVQQVAGSGSGRVIAHVLTGADGSFLARVPPGPSRVIEIAYRAFETEPSYAAVAQVLESVSAGVRLDIAPRATSSTGTIVLSGRVLGPVPRHGVLVELLVHYLAAWQPLRTPRTDSSGRFRVAYQFQGAVGNFPFRVEVPDGQAGFAFATGYSAPIAVSAH